MSASRKTPKHAQIAAEVRRHIRKNRLRVGDAIPTEQELAQTFACSRGTVRRALDTLVNDGLIRRKQGAGHFVSRQANADRESLLGLILPNILNAEVLRLAQKFTLEASHKGYRVLLGVMEEQPAFEREFLNDLYRLKVSGVIKFPTTPQYEGEVRAQMRGLGLPYVIINDFWTDCRRDHHIAFDEAYGVESIVNHLVELGHRRIGWVDGSDGPREHALAALRHALTAHKLTLPDSRILFSRPYETPEIETLFSDPKTAPTALITPYDGMAVRLIDAIQRHGLSVPEDVSVANLNGPPFYAQSGLEMTTTLPPNDQIVQRALEILTQDAQHTAVCQYLFKCALHVGGTTAPPREDKARTPSEGAMR